MHVPAQSWDRIDNCGDRSIRMCGMLLNDLAVHREIILADVVCTHGRVCAHATPCIKLAVSRAGSRDIRVHRLLYVVPGA